MARLYFDGGVQNGMDPSEYTPGGLEEGVGVEYVANRRGIRIAGGRKIITKALQGIDSIYYAGFDGNDEKLVFQYGDTLEYFRLDSVFQRVYERDQVIPGNTFDLSPGAAPIVGSHFGNRHFIAATSGNAVLEPTGAGSWRRMGLQQPSAVPVMYSNLLLGSDPILSGLDIWWTEYDKTTGRESAASGRLSWNAGDLPWAGMQVAFGPTINPETTAIRVYRSADGSAYPVGGLWFELPLTTTGAEQTVIHVVTADDLVDLTIRPDPAYGIVSIGGLLGDRDLPPPPLKSIATFQGSLCGFSATEPRNLRFSAAGRPESWPEGYYVPLDTSRQDEGIGSVEVSNMLCALTRDQIWRITKFPRSSNAAFAPEEYRHRITNERGCVSRRGFTLFTPLSSRSFVGFVARDGVYATDLYSVYEMTSGIHSKWEEVVDVNRLSLATLSTHPSKRRLVMTYYKPDDADGYPTGVMSLYYSVNPETRALESKILHTDNGILQQTVLAPYDGKLELYSCGHKDDPFVYVEGAQDYDDQNLSSAGGAAGTFPWAVKTGELTQGNHVISMQNVGIKVSETSDGLPTSMLREYQADDDAGVSRQTITVKGDKPRIVNDTVAKEAVRSSLRFSGQDTRTFELVWMEAELEDEGMSTGEGST